MNKIDKSKEVFKLLDKKEVRCRHCNNLMEFDKNRYECDCGSYKEQHYYVKFKNGHIYNLADYLNENWEEENIIDIIEYELKDRK
ncbi:hypothetical protein [Terrisporobacter sp.]|uniref:hypothetical protein n=1 Tax=Terrisporobacter sp. TaxID=1965305 RepID=UPI00289A8902|nr:hypothetical protein [Terrisporobacter sp.]